MPGIAGSDERFRCGRWVVSSELSIAELLAKCEEPTSRQVTTEDVWVAGKSGRFKAGTTTKEVWRYDRGSRAAAMLVTIVDGTVESLEREK